MSHKPNVFSPPGTPLVDRTVGELVAERPGRSRVFQTFSIDFCCQGGRTLREACEGKGVAVESVIEQLEAELREKTAPKENPAELPLDQLARYIVETHHKFLNREMPRLHAMAQRVAQVHGGHTPSLVEVYEVYSAVEEELNVHMMKEERVLFPAVIALVQGQSAPMPLDEPIECMLHEHEVAGAGVARLRELTRDYIPPAEACNTYRALFAGLKDFEEDLHRHIHLENAVLFPAAIQLSKAGQ